MKELLLWRFALCLLSACLFSACTADEQPGIEAGEEDVFTLCLETNAPIEAETRAVNESAINDLWIVQLAADGNSALVVPQYFTASQLSSKPDGSKLIRLSLQRVACKICILANTGNSSLFDTSAALTSITKSVVEGKGISYSGDWKAKMDALGYIPMSATWNGTPDVGTEISVTLTRAIAKLTATISVSIPSGDVLTISSVQLKNIPATLQYWRETMTGTYPAAGGTYFDYTAVTSYASNTWWMPENCRGSGSGRYETEKTANAVTDGAKATYLEIKGKYNGFDVTYSFYLGENTTNDYNVKRNYNYSLQITIKGNSSLDARVQVEENKLAWGDILCVSGGKQLYTVKPDKYDASMHKAVGVVFYVGAHAEDVLSDYAGRGMGAIHGYAIALKDAGTNIKWGTYGTKLNVTATSETDFKGYYNTQGLKNCGNGDLPAYYTIAAYKSDIDLPATGNSGWYFPSCGQVRYINDNNRSTFNTYLEKVGGSGMTFRYWTSMESIWAGENSFRVNMGSGHAEASKSTMYYVRAAVTF